MTNPLAVTPGLLAPTAPLETPVVPPTPVVAPEVDLSVAPTDKASPEYEAWLTAKADASLAEKANAGKILGKFNTQEDLIAAYEAAQAELTRTKQGVVKPVVPPVVAPVVTTPGDGNIDLDKYSAEVTTTGVLSEASYAELQAKGLSKATVDKYIAGETALNERARTEVLSVVGGADAFASMQTWAATNLTADETTRFNAQVDANKDSALMAVSWLAEKYRAANGNAPKNLIMGSGVAPASTGFASQAEVMEAMRDPRYYKDPAYAASVAKRLANKSF